MSKTVVFTCPAPKLYILVVPPEGVHLSGAFSFQPLYGHFEVNGYVFEPAAYSQKSFVPICTPQLTHIPVHFTVLADIFNRQRLLYRLKEIYDRHEKIVDLIEEKQDYGVLLVRCEADVATKFVQQQVPEFSVKVLDKYKHFPIGPSCHCVEGVKRNGPPPSLFEEALKAAVDKLIDDVLKPSEQRRVVVVTGNKGVGKSTVIRYMLNRLNQRRNGSVYLLDSDIGQSELTPPGLVSLHNVKKPLLSASFIHPESTFTNSYFFGATSTQINIRFYLRLVDQAIRDFREKSSPKSVLVVNTMGWVEGEGQNIMYHIIKSSRATIVLNLNSHDTNVIDLRVPSNMANVINVATSPREKFVPAFE
ncbi:CRE-NOL-9 protein [Aphelenchoides avenae]|nr:CRE-NOL-9 protein [Aphelenchus avenae]